MAIQSDPYGTVPPMQYENQQTAVQMLAEPSQMLVHSIVNLINYQDDADLATKALPELIKLLSDEDQLIVSQAAMLVHQLARKQASRDALCNSASLVKALLQTIESSNDSETVKFTSEILSSLSQQQQGLLAIFKTGGIKALIYALSSPVDAVVFNALTTLHNLLLHQEGARMTVRLNGGLQKMVNLLQRDYYKFLAVVADCLHMLTYGNQEGKLIVLASGGPSELIRILHSYSYEKLLYTTARVVKVLSACPSCKPALIQAGAMQVLALCLDHPSKRLTQECLWSLRNLSDTATKEINLEPLLQKLIQYLESADVNVLTCSAGTLSNLTCNNASNKSFIIKVGGLQAIVQTIRNAGDRDDIIEPSIRTLIHMMNRHNDANVAKDTLRMIESHEGIITSLMNSQNEDVRQRAALLLTILSSDEAPEYTQRLSNEIDALFQGGPNDRQQWVDTSQDIPAVYTLEGPSIHNPTSSHTNNPGHEIYTTGSSTYVNQHDIESAYGRTKQIPQQASGLIDPSQSHMQQTPQPNEPWFDTDL